MKCSSGDSTTNPPASRSLWRWFATLALLLAAVLRLGDLGGQSFWYDEAYTWWASVELSPAASLDSSIREFIPPFAYFLWRFWAALMGTSELALRGASALAGIVAVAASGAVAWRLTRSRRAQVAAVVLATVAPPLVWASREMRMYGPLLASVLLADWALVEVLFGRARHRWLWAWVWGMSALISLYTVVLAGFWLLGQGCFALVVLLRLRDRERALSLVRALWLPALAAALLYLPWLIPALRALGGNQGYWPGTLTADVFFERTLRGMVVFRGIGSVETAVTLSVAVVAFGAVVVPLLSPRGRQLTLWAVVSTVPPLLFASVLFRGIPKWELQHTVVFAPGVILGLAGTGAGLAGGQRLSLEGAQEGKRLRRAIARLWTRTPRSKGVWSGVRGWVLRLGLMAVGGVLAYASGRLLLDPALAHEDWRGAVAYVEAHRSEGEPVILSTGAIAPAWLYYGRADGLLPLPDDPLLDVRHVLNYGNTAPVLNEALARAPGVWVVGWLDAVTDPTGIVEALLGDLGDGSHIPGYHGLNLDHYVLTHAPDFPEEPTATARPDAELLRDVRLWGITLPTLPLPADRFVPVRAWWTVSNPSVHIGRVYQASVRVVDAKGHVWGTADGPAGAGDYRPERWPPDTAVMGVYRVPLMPGTPSGVYTATVTLYSLDGVTSDSIVVGAFPVGRPSSPPVVPEMVVPDAYDGVGGPMTLIGVQVAGSVVHPCETLEGRLLWEISSPLVVSHQAHVWLEAGADALLSPADLTPMAWQVGDRYLTPFKLEVDCRALRSYAPLRIALSVVDREEVGGAEVAQWAGPDVEIAVARTFTPPELMLTADIQVGQGIADLVGYNVVPAAVNPGVPFSLELYWQAGKPTDTPYTVFVHIVPKGSPSPLEGQHDSWPAEGGKPTYTWVPGEIVTDPHPLQALPAGEYDIRVGVYGPDTVRLPIVQDGVRVPDDVVVLTELSVE